MIDIYKKVKAYCGDCYGAYYKDCYKVRILFTDLACYTSYLDAVGVKENVLVLKLDGVKNL